MKRGSKPKYNPEKHHRRSIRLPGYDYSQVGAYFVTIATHQRDCLFGKILNCEMILNEFGRTADECWRTSPDHFDHVELRGHVIMPNRAHGIVIINDAAVVGARHVSPLRPRGPKLGSLGAIVGLFKSAVSKRINREHNATGIWQRNYYEHVIRNDREMDAIWRYIESNPLNWDNDNENPDNL